MKDNSNAGYTHEKRVCKDFKKRNLGDCHDVYVQRDTLLLADVLENLQNMCLEIWAWPCSLSVCTRISIASSHRK